MAISRPKRFIGREIKLALAVIADIRRRHRTDLQPVGSDYLAAPDLLDDQMIANVIERIDVAFDGMRSSQSFAEFEG